MKIKLESLKISNYVQQYCDDSMYDNYIFMGLSINHLTDPGELYMVQMKEKFVRQNVQGNTTQETNSIDYAMSDVQEGARARC